MALLPQSSLQVLQIQERKNLLFLQIANEGMYLFDNQANFIKKIAISGDTPAFIDNEHIYCVSDNSLRKTNFLSDREIQLQLPNLPKVTALALTNNSIFLMDAHTLRVFNRPKAF